MVAANSRDCIRACMGKRIRGVLFDALPLRRPDLSAGTKTFVFDDGTGFTLASNGSFWTEGVGDIKDAIAVKQRELADTNREITEVLTAAGVQ